MKKIIVTGGAGFIGSALIRYLVSGGLAEVVNLDKLTYAGNLESVREVASSPLYHFAKLDICDADGFSKLLSEFQPDSVMHLAAESHVDRSIDDPLCFIRTNVTGTANLNRALQEALNPPRDGVPELKYGSIVFRMGDRVMILSARPARIREMLDIRFDGAARTPLTCRNDARFGQYFDHIWKELMAP